MNDQNLNNYHWTSMNVSEWAEDKIRGKLAALGYKVVDPSIQAHISNRMRKLSLVYFYSLRAEKGSEWMKLCSFDGYCDMSDVLGSNKDDVRSFFEFLKELETTAVNVFRDRQYTDPSSRFEKHVEHDFVIGSGQHCAQNSKNSRMHDDEKLVDTKLEFQMSCTEAEFINFLTNPSFVAVWSANQFSIAESQMFLLGKAVLNNIDKEKDLQFKMNDWKRWSDMKIESQNGNITIKLNNVPHASKDIATSFWCNGVIDRMCRAFGFRFRLVE